MLEDLIWSGVLVRYFLATREGVVGWSILREREEEATEHGRKSDSSRRAFGAKGGLCLE